MYPVLRLLGAIFKLKSLCLELRYNHDLIEIKTILIIIKTNQNTKGDKQ